MTAGEMEAARARIRELLPDGNSVLMSLRRKASRSEWEDLREWYLEAVGAFYERFAASWDSMPVLERERLCERAGLCWSRSRDVSQLAWKQITPSVKRRLYRWVPARVLESFQNS